MDHTKLIIKYYRSNRQNFSLLLAKGSAIVSRNQVAVKNEIVSRVI